MANILEGMPCRVLVRRKWIPPSKGTASTLGHWGEPEYQDAIFLDLSVDYEQLENGTRQFPVAVVMFKDGQLGSANVINVQILNTDTEGEADG